MSEYLINYEDIQANSVNELIDVIEKIEGIRLEVLTVKDLGFYNSQDIRTGNGVYIFKDGNNILYVGKCSSRNFVERIPGHFDIRHSEGFNSLLRNIVKNSDEEQNDENIAKAARYSFENLSLLLINFKGYDKLKINRLEYLLRIVLKPLNKFRTKHFHEFEKSIREVIEIKV